MGGRRWSWLLLEALFTARAVEVAVQLFVNINSNPHAFGEPRTQCRTRSIFKWFWHSAQFFSCSCDFVGGTE